MDDKLSELLDKLSALCREYRQLKGMPIHQLNQIELANWGLVAGLVTGAEWDQIARCRRWGPWGWEWMWQPK